MCPPATELFGIRLNPLRMSEAVQTIGDWVADPFSRCRVVVTPNVDHLVLLKEHIGLRQAYAEADLVLADGLPLIWASRWFGRRLPERVAGSDLVPALFAAAHSQRPLRVFWLGGAAGVAQRAALRVGRDWPNVLTVDCDSPPFGFQDDDRENSRILEKIAASEPDVLVVGLGAPKQELWVRRHKAQLRAKVALCVGATIDFLAGEKKRAPQWMQKCGLEWLHRMAGDPRRLILRYARDAWIFPQILWQQARSHRS